MKPWGILSSMILLSILGATSILIGFSVPGIGTFLIILGVFLLIIGYGLMVQDSLAWWIALFMAVMIPSFSLFAIGYLTTFMIAFGILLLLGLLHKGTIKAIKPTGITYEGWFLE